MQPDQRATLLAAKLVALVRDRWGVDDSRPVSFPEGAAVSSGGTAWVLVGDDGRRRLGGAMAWARQQGASELHLLADDPAVAAVLARRATLFAPAPTVWRVDGRTLRLADVAPAPTFAVPPPGAELLRPLLVAAGVQVVSEGGELLGEVAGLEVARAVADGDGGDARLEVGVGRFDREAFAMMNEGLAPAEKLAKAAAIVADHRRPGAPRHQLNQLVPERWLRSELLAVPSLVGARELLPVESAVPRPNLNVQWPASAVGPGIDGRPVVVTCSVGVDLDMVPSAADDRLAHAPTARLVLVMPGRDVAPVTEELAARLVDPAEIVTLEHPWQAE